MKKFKIRKEETNEQEKKYKKVSYKHLVDRYIDNLVLCNNIAEIDPSIFENVEVGEITENTEIYQYFLCNLNNYDIEDLNEYNTNDILVMYSEVLDCDVLAVEHVGTSWDYVITDIELEEI